MTPQWALIVDRYNRIRHVRLERVEVEVARNYGAYVIAREDVELCQPPPVPPPLTLGQWGRSPRRAQADGDEGDDQA